VFVSNHRTVRIKTNIKYMFLEFHPKIWQETYKEKTKMIPTYLHPPIHFHVLSDMLHSQVEKCMMGRVEKGGGKGGEKGVVRAGVGLMIKLAYRTRPCGPMRMRYAS
jgi:hypothetical protein